MLTMLRVEDFYMYYIHSWKVPIFLITLNTLSYPALGATKSWVLECERQDARQPTPAWLDANQLIDCFQSVGFTVHVN